MMKLKVLIVIILVLIALTGCNNANEEEIIIYTSVDRVYSEPIFESFYKETGIKVLAVYDVEASKTTGIVQRLIQEKNKPKADVFWNGEIVQMLRLKDENILEVYKSSSAKNFKNEFVDEEYKWTAFGGRARIFLINTNLLEKNLWPSSWLDIAADSRVMNVGIAKPMFGTSSTHIAGLYTIYGQEYTLNEYSKMKSNGVYLADGNGAVRDMVVSGALSYGLTDTDDALVALKKGANVAIVFPDQLSDEIGTMVIPNSVGLIKNGPNSKNAKEFIDYLLSIETRDKLMNSGWFQINVDGDIKVVEELKSFIPEIHDIKFMDVNYYDLIKNFNSSQEDIINLFLD